MALKISVVKGKIMLKTITNLSIGLKPIRWPFEMFLKLNISSLATSNKTCKKQRMTRACNCSFSVLIVFVFNSNIDWFQCIFAASHRGTIKLLFFLVIIAMNGFTFCTQFCRQNFQWYKFQLLSYTHICVINIIGLTISVFVEP